MTSLVELKAWIARDVGPRRWTVEAVEESEHSLIYLVKAARYFFTVHADAKTNYLACTACTRWNQPGEDHPRFADLPDGKLTPETWEAILAEMKRMEVRPFRGPAL